MPLKPGEKAPASGQYGVIGPRGGKLNKEVTVVKCEPMYSGPRIGEVCGLAWQDINLKEQYLTVKWNIRYDGSKHRTIIGPTKRKKIRTVDFGDTLTAILRKARKNS